MSTKRPQFRESILKEGAFRELIKGISTLWLHRGKLDDIEYGATFLGEPWQQIARSERSILLFWIGWKFFQCRRPKKHAGGIYLD